MIESVRKKLVSHLICELINAIKIPRLNSGP